VLLAETLRSSTFKLALICIAAFGAIVIALFSYVYWSTATYVLSRSDRAIEAEQTALRNDYDTAGRAGLITSINRNVADARFKGSIYLLADPAFSAVAGNLESWPAGLSKTDGWNNFSFTEQRANQTQPPLLRATTETLADGYHLLVGRDIEDLDQFAKRIGTALASVVAMIFALATAAAIIVSRRTVGRIESVNATSRSIMQSGLGTRIPLRGTRDEWDQVAENLNLMLDRIEGLMGEIKQVTDNVAHDLRTPLTRMRGRLEKAHGEARNAAADQALIGNTIADLDAVLGIFSSLTRISQIETSDRKSAFRIVDLADIASEVAELFDAAAEIKHGCVEVKRPQHAPILGDRDLLFDAVANLVDNAIKHGRDGVRVALEVSQTDTCTVISVVDDGPGIPTHEFQHVFKRFYRLERSRLTPGNGLGLSLVAAVARLHGARIEMMNNAPGFTFQLWFPLPANS
jgi:signal transduction histidine kinase